MLFLIHYHRESGRLLELRAFNDKERDKAEDARLALELQLQRAGIEHEIVLLDASDEDALRKTHRRYFETWQDIAKSA